MRQFFKQSSTKDLKVIKNSNLKIISLLLLIKYNVEYFKKKGYDFNMEKILYNIIRYILKKKFTGFLGDVLEEEDKIICNVKYNRLKKKRYYLDIFCRNIDEDNKELAKKYNLDKQICYIFDGLTFKKNYVNIYGYDNCEIIIKNCVFDDGLYLTNDGKSFVKDTLINSSCNRITLGSNDLKVDNICVAKDLDFCSNLDFCMSVKNTLKISNTNLDLLKENIYLYSFNEIYVENSFISGPYILIEAKKLNFNNSKLNVKRDFELTVESCDQVKVNADRIICHKMPCNLNREEIIINNDINNLMFQYKELKEVLKKIKNKCEEANEIKKFIYREKLNNSTISRVLKK